MRSWPLRFRETSDRLLFTDDAGGWFRATEGFLERYAEDRLSPGDTAFLQSGGQIFGQVGDLAHTAFAWRWARRLTTASPLSYIILVPTLRCGLSCDYCQVSRAPLQAKGFDWSAETLSQVLAFLGRLETDEIKIEFQGGEPTLRLDLLSQVRDFCRTRFKVSQFVVCTNLQDVAPETWAFLEADDTFTSTSIDGDIDTHQRQRTANREQTRRFFDNIEAAVRRLGADHLSALPTIDPNAPPDLGSLISTYENLGLRSIYLRPINYHGFARRQPANADQYASWRGLYDAFIELLIERNARTGTLMEEFYFSLHLRRFLAAGQDNHVDVRNPNLLGTNYLLIDHDGTLYPTDEARMLARMGQADLSIGHVRLGIDAQRRDQLNQFSMNNFDPDCIHCAYQPYCGTDIVDDLSRYGRIDMPRHQTWFCQRQLQVFDKIVELIYRDDTATRASLAHWAGIANWPEGLARSHQ